MSILRGSIGGVLFNLPAFTLRQCYGVAIDMKMPMAWLSFNYIDGHAARACVNSQMGPVLFPKMMIAFLFLIFSGAHFLFFCFSYFLCF